MNAHVPRFQTRLARSEAEVRASQRLRYAVFVAELGGGGSGVDHAAGLETDTFDAVADHLLLFDANRPAPDDVVGVYRVMTEDAAARAGGFYSEQEFDIAPLRASGLKLLELGRSCLHPDYRGGAALHHLWTGLARYVADRDIDVLFGVASFHGTDLAALAAPLSLLHAEHLAPPGLRPVSLTGPGPRRALAAPFDRKAAMRATPALIKAYLRLGGMIGDGVFVDHAFNTTDVCLVLRADGLSQRQRANLFGTGSPPG